MRTIRSFDYDKLGLDERGMMFSFWTGPLPAISRLHFLTATKYLPKGCRYVLFTYKATIPRSLSDEMERHGVVLCELDFPGLMKEAGFSGKWQRTDNVRRHIGKAPKWLRRHLGHEHPILGFAPRRNGLFGWPMKNAAMIANYVRVIIGSIVPLPTVYADIDFAFTGPLHWAFAHNSFVYRWERYPFANNALMAIAESSPIKRGALLELVREEGTPSPWILLSEQNCRRCGLEILSCDRLDPMWSSTHPSSQGFLEFIERHEDSAATLAALKKNFDAIHWHNKWSAIPQLNSPYDLWISEFSALHPHEMHPV